MARKSKSLEKCGLYPFGDDPRDTTYKQVLWNDILNTMLRYTQQMFKYENLPDTVPQRMLELMLQTAGVICFANVNDSLYCFEGGLGGPPDPYYRPTCFTVANPALKFNKTLTIGTDCEIMLNDSLMMGLMPILNKYATLLMENTLTMRMVDINSRIPMIISAGDDRTRASGEEYMRKIIEGRLAIYGEHTFFDGDGVRVSPYSANTNRPITSLIEYNQFLRAGWLNELGIQLNNNFKRETLTSDEISMADDALHPLVDDMLEQRQDALNKINAMFGTNISVHFSSSWERNKKDLEAQIDLIDVEKLTADSKTDGGDQVDGPTEIE